MIPSRPKKPNPLIKEYGWLAIPILLFVIVRFVLGFNGLYGQDAHEYLRCTNWILNLMHGNHTDTQFFWPLAYPFLGGLLSMAGVNAIWALQIISLLAFIGSLWMSYKIILLIHPAFQMQAKYFVILIIMPTTYFLRAAYFVMSDMQAAFFILSTFYFVILFLRKEKAQYMVFAGVMGTLAFFSRYAAGIILFVPAVVLLQQTIKKRKIYSLILMLVCSTVLSILFMKLKGNMAYGLTDHLQVHGWSLSNFFKSSFNTIDGYSQNHVINLLYAFSLFVHPGYIMAGIFLILFLRRTDFLHPTQMLLLLPVFIYLIVIMGMPFQNMRFLLIAFPLAAIWMFPAWVRAGEWLKKRKTLKYAAIVVLVVANIAMLIYSGRSFILQNRVEKEIATEVITNVAPEIPIYTFSIDPALRSYGVKNPVFNIWENDFTDYSSGVDYFLITKNSLYNGRMLSR